MKLTNERTGTNGQLKEHNFINKQKMDKINRTKEIQEKQKKKKQTKKKQKKTTNKHKMKDIPFLMNYNLLLVNIFAVLVKFLFLKVFEIQCHRNVYIFLGLLHQNIL